MRNIVLNAPVTRGRFISLKDCGEVPFVNGAMGRGIAVRNANEGRIISPFDGRVLKVFRNAITIASNNGINLFIQVADSVFYEVSVKRESADKYQSTVEATRVIIQIIFRRIVRWLY